MVEEHPPQTSYQLMILFGNKIFAGVISKDA